MDERARRDPKSPFTRRLLGAATLSVPTYEEIEADPSATVQAAGVVGLVALASALGALEVGPGGLIAGVLGAYLGWALWSATCYIVGVRIFGGTADWGELLRTIGFAQVPGVLLVLRILPGFGTLLYLFVLLWMIGAVLVAIRQALDFGSGRALATALAGSLPYALGTAVLERLLHITPSLLP